MWRDTGIDMMIHRSNATGLFFRGSANLVLLIVALITAPVAAEVVFQDDFSESDGTAIDGKASDIGGTWSSGNAANEVNGNAFTQVDYGSGDSGVSFTRALGAGGVVTVTLVTGPGSTFTAGGWSGLSIRPLSGGGTLSFGDSGGSNSEWEETDAHIKTSDSSAFNTVTITYAYDTGAWTLDTTALPGSAFGTSTAGLAIQELRFWDDGSGGSVIEYDSITVSIEGDVVVPPVTNAPSISYVDWSMTNLLTTGRYGDQDDDGQINLHEYATGGNPTNPAETGIAPVYSIVEENGTNWLYYTYPELAGSMNNVEYSLRLADNLLSSNWASTGYEEVGVGSNVFASGFNAVTNRINMAGKQTRFVGMNIGSAGPDEWRGGDISMVPRFEELGGAWKIDGRVLDPIQIMMDYGMNTFRVRLFVEPDGAWDGAIQDLPYVTALGQRIKNAGGAFLLDIHYSDTWADPGNQSKPAAWEGLSFSELEAQVESYSSNVIATLKSAGCLPDYVQVGNEITPGFLFPEGKLYDEPLGGWSNFTTLLKAGIRGVKQPLDAGEDMKIMIHIDKGGDQSATHYFYSQLDSYGVEYDIIGLSFYPWWHGTLADLQATINDAAISFGKEIVVVETAYPWNSTYSTMEWDQTPAGQKQFIEDVMQALRSVPGGLGKGVVWWYPEAVDDVPIGVWEGGANALFDGSWNALPALEAF